MRVAIIGEPTSLFADVAEVYRQFLDTRTSFSDRIEEDERIEAVPWNGRLGTVNIGQENDFDVVIFVHWSRSRAAAKRTNKQIRRMWPYLIDRGVFRVVTYAKVGKEWTARSASGAYPTIYVDPISTDGMFEVIETARRRYLYSKIRDESMLISQRALALPTVRVPIDVHSLRVSLSYGFEMAVHQGFMPTMVFTNGNALRTAMATKRIPLGVIKRALFWFPPDVPWYNGAEDGRHFKHTTYENASKWLSGTQDPQRRRARLAFSPLNFDNADSTVREALDANTFDEDVIGKLLSRIDQSKPVRRGHQMSGYIAHASIPPDSAPAEWAKRYTTFGRSIANLEARRRSLLRAGAQAWDVYDLIRDGPIETLLTLTRVDDLYKLDDPLPYDYSQIASLGSGTYGSVIKVMGGLGHPHAGEELALKVQLDRGDTVFETTVLGLVSRIPDEIAHATPYVPHVYNAYRLAQDTPGTRQLIAHVASTSGRLSQSGSHIVIEMPVYTGSLYRISPQNPQEMREWFFQLFHSIMALDSLLGFRHYDIKPDNLFVRNRNPRTDSVHVTATRVKGRSAIRHSSRGGTIAVLADFGFSSCEHVTGLRASDHYPSKTERDVMGSAAYLAPTSITYLDSQKSDSDNSHDAPERGIDSDLWALGISCVEVAWNVYVTHSPFLRLQTFIIPEPIIGTFSDDRVRAALLQAFDGMPYHHMIFDVDRPQRAINREVFIIAGCISLYHALNGTPPKIRETEGDTMGSGDYFARLIETYETWSTALKVANPFDQNMTPHEFAVSKLDPEDVAFFRKCLKWYPDERIGFLRSGAAISSPLFRFMETEEWGEYRL